MLSIIDQPASSSSKYVCKQTSWLTSSLDGLICVKKSRRSLFAHKPWCLLSLVRADRPARWMGPLEPSNNATPTWVYLNRDCDAQVPRPSKSHFESKLLRRCGGELHKSDNYYLSTSGSSSSSVRLGYTKNSRRRRD